jgi:hypothetical protein
MKSPSRNKQNIRLFARRIRSAKQSLLLAACVSGVAAFGVTKPALAASAVSAPALFNEGNAAQRAGRLGPAILEYERARQLAPHDGAIEQNLGIARQKAGVTAAPVPAWERPAHWLSFDCLAALASISLLLFCLLFFGTRLIPTGLRSLARGAASSLGALILLASAAIALRWPELNRAVIIGSQPSAHIAPAADSSAAFALRPGELVHAEDSYGAFVRIRTENGRSGWVAAAEVERIIPAAS